MFKHGTFTVSSSNFKYFLFLFSFYYFFRDPKKYLKSAFFASYLEIFLLELMRLQVFFKDLKKKNKCWKSQEPIRAKFPKKREEKVKMPKFKEASRR